MRLGAMPLYSRSHYLYHIELARRAGFTGLADAITEMFRRDYPSK